MGYDTGKKFKLAANGKKIVGFHGSAEKNVNSLGAYVTTFPITKLESKGDTNRGGLWDDGTFEGVRKVYVVYATASDYGSVSRVMLNYDNTAVKALGEEGKFEVDYPNELITSVEGTFYMESTKNKWVSSLTFRTSKGRTSPTFGRATNSKFMLESKGCALVGFHGRSTSKLRALGAYFCLMPPDPDAEKLEARGGDGGASWDDGSFDGIQKIYIGIGDFINVAFVKFLYDKDSQLVVGDDHGSKKLPGFGYEEFELGNNPSEYLISVEGSYDLVDGGKSEAIVMLRFKTNMRTSPTFGTEAGTNFILHKKNHKIVGFHGKASIMLHQIGVHVLPIT
ncbi:hypothetical protein EUTSA_v10011637mg [Eutrema salsugineum]|uniref:Jacalin-type lectin domain-containing protein n=3 Tax=Eutrema salsugineum TaxID=72664 RepID=V4KSB6_EUTSA|nr:hypothetical protein EUTSA_v10011637mg [Eutrema salsugineum]